MQAQNAIQRICDRLVHERKAEVKIRKHLYQSCVAFYMHSYETINMLINNAIRIQDTKGEADVGTQKIKP